MIDYVNNHNGFTVIGWYKRGEIDDHTQTNEQKGKVEAGEIGHVISIFPTKGNINIEAFKFNVGKLH